MSQINKRVFLVALLILIVAYVTPLIPSALADTDEVDDEIESINERTVEVRLFSGRIEIESELRNGENKDEFELEVKAGSNGLEFKMKYTTEANDAESEIEFRFILAALIEYIDLNADETYSGVDTLIQNVPLTSFQPFDYWTEVSGTGSTVHIVNVTSTDGVFTVEIYAVEEFELVNTTLVVPNEMKFDIGIHNFNYLNVGSDLALKVKLNSTDDYHTEQETDDEIGGYSTGEMEVETSINGFTGFLSWKETALIDGIELPVKSSTVSGVTGDQFMYLNYPRGTDIIHDPKVGIEGILRVPLNIVMLILIVAIIAGAAILTVLLLRHRTKSNAIDLTA